MLEAEIGAELIADAITETEAWGEKVEGKRLCGQECGLLSKGGAWGATAVAGEGEAESQIEAAEEREVEIGMGGVDIGDKPG